VGKTPGIVLPSFFASQQELEADVRRRSEEAGFTPIEETKIIHTESVIEDFLAHYGVKGMHWGITNEQQSDGSSGPPKLYKAYRRSKPAVVAVGMGAAFVTSGAVGMTFPVSAPVVLAAGFVGGAVAENIFARTGKMKIKEIK